MRYSRDMLGHGQTPPDAAWPGGAKIAISLVVNYEEGGENSIEHGDAGSEAFLSEIIGAQSWPGQRHWNMESLYDYGARAGFWRLRRVLDGAGVPATVYGVATALARAPQQVAAMQESGWEIASHGLRWIEYKDADPETEAAHLRDAIALHEQVTGEAPRGFYLGRCSMNTVALATQTGQFDWLSDCYDDDLPYWRHQDGRDQLMIPYTLDANDMRFSSGQGFGTPDDFFEHLRDAFDMLYAEGQSGAPKMMSIGLHCRLAGKPGRALALKRFIEHAQAHEGVWFARRCDIAAHWAAAHPPQGRERVTMLDRDAFVARFGGVFEHSPWVAEETFDGELGPAHDDAAGLAAAMARVFRAAPESRRLEVLRAHPDLAGKLAAAKRLTAESTSEQASAGLDALTDDERARFTELNASYTARHGFPFIIAVRDHDKAGILAAFERRIAHDTATEQREAEAQVCRIAALRLQEMLG